MTIKTRSKVTKRTTSAPQYEDTGRRIMPTAVRVGMLISSNDNKVLEVRTIEYNACSHHGTHVNGNACFDTRFSVKVWDKA